MFWKPKPTIDLDDQLWQVETWAWLLKNLGGADAMRTYCVVVPSHLHFPPSECSGQEHAEFVFKQVAGQFRVATDEFILTPQEVDINPSLGPLAVVQDVPTNPLGTYSASDTDEHTISYSPSLLADLQALIATFTHEICHPILLGIPDEPPGGSEAEEFATDLAMVFFGFGIFGANGSFAFNQYSDVSTGSQGWSYSRAGYLTQSEWGFGLAVRAMLLDEDEELLLKFLTSGVAAHFRKNLRYLKSSDELLDQLSA